ncbi:hypothetical protein BROC_01232 [Candidatus Brocadiaceae bacterium]|nr:hypothetical protein BROC_01232 [Candidatus Brocadiaceae bacterium]
MIMTAICCGVLEGCAADRELHTSTNLPQGNIIIQGTLNAEEKGCLSCHEGIDVINDRMQPFLLSFAKVKYGKGRGYECAICHEGNPASGRKEEVHNDLIQNPSSM